MCIVEISKITVKAVSYQFSSAEKIIIRDLSTVVSADPVSMRKNISFETFIFIIIYFQTRLQIREIQPEEIQSLSFHQRPSARCFCLNMELFCCNFLMHPLIPKISGLLSPSISTITGHRQIIPVN